MRATVKKIKANPCCCLSIRTGTLVLGTLEIVSLNKVFTHPTLFCYEICEEQYVMSDLDQFK